MLNYKELYNTPNLVFLTNAMGEDTGHETVFKPMQDIYNDVASLSKTDGLLYMAKLNGLYGLLLNYEFDDAYCDGYSKGDRQAMSRHVHDLSGKMEKVAPEWCEVLVGDGTGVDGCDELAVFVDLFKSRQRQVDILNKMDKIIMGEDADMQTELMEQMVHEARQLLLSTPNACGIQDADTVLADILEDAEAAVSGTANEIFDIWEKSSDRKSVGALFESMTGVSFKVFLERCINETTRK